MAILSFGVLQCLRKVVVAMMRIGYEHVDRLITYPYLHNLSASAQPIRMSGRQPGKPRSDQRGVEQTSRKARNEVSGAQRAASIAAFAVFRPTPVRSR